MPNLSKVRTTGIRLTAGDGAKVDDGARVALLELAHEDLGNVDEADDWNQQCTVVTCDQTHRW